MKETVSFRIFSARKEEKDKGRCRLVINLFKRSGFRTFRKFMSSRVGTAHTLLPESGLGSNIGPATYQLPDPGLDLRAPRSMSGSTSVLHSGWYPKPSPAPILSYLLGGVRKPSVIRDRNPTLWIQRFNSGPQVSCPCCPLGSTFLCSLHAQAGSNYNYLNQMGEHK